MATTKKPAKVIPIRKQHLYARPAPSVLRGPARRDEPRKSTGRHGAGAMTFESAIRYVHNPQAQEAPVGGEAEAFRAAASSGDWRKVATALAYVLKMIVDDAGAIVWSDEDRGRGGVEPNFTLGLKGAHAVLAEASDAAAAFAAVSDLTRALRALAIKASGTTPKNYRGEPGSK